MRSPSEFAEDHVPGAANLPGARRRGARPHRHALQAGVAVRREEARRGAGVEQHRAPHRGQLRAARRDWRPLVYCWRGGKRSGAMAHVLREIGWQAAQLEGGYRPTGARSSRSSRPAARIPLPRRLRRHRLRQEPAARGAGARGRAGARPRAARLPPRLGARQPARRAAAVAEDVRQPASGTPCADSIRTRPVFVEAESKKIGQLQVPEALLERMRAACILSRRPSPSASVPDRGIPPFPR